MAISERPGECFHLRNALNITKEQKASNGAAPTGHLGGGRAHNYPHLSLTTPSHPIFLRNGPLCPTGHEVSIQHKDSNYVRIFLEFVL